LFQGYERARVSPAASPSLEQIVQQFEPLDRRLSVLLPAAMQRLETLIRKNPQEFVAIL
jgi:hypothetical protein